MNMYMKTLVVAALASSVFLMTGCGEPTLDCSKPEATDKSLAEIMQSIEKNFGKSDAAQTKLFVKTMLFANQNDLVCGKSASDLRSMAKNPVKKQVNELKNDLKKNIDAGAQKAKDALDALTGE